jgi:hypothetical protein
MSLTAPKRENLFLNLACNVAAPVIILSKLSDADRLGPKLALLLALAFPLAYGLQDLIRRRHFNVISALGFTSTLATGGLSLLKLDPFWFAVKEAIVPALIGLTVLLTRHSKSSLLRALMLNPQVVNVPRINEGLREARQEAAFERVLDQTNWLLVASFGLSTVLNFVLARMIITAMPDTAEFNAQLGRLTWISYIVIAVPSMAITVFALWRMFHKIGQLTGLKMDDMLQPPPDKKTESAEQA